MVNRNFILFFSLLASILLYSCKNRVNLYDHTAAIVELGNDFYYLGDGSESQILLNLKPGAKSKVGKTVIPPEVILYNHDNNFIIAQTLERVNGKQILKYWIVEKAVKNQVTVLPLDSASFYKNTDNLGIKMKLKPRQ
ncbi:MAG: hypothetical protein MUE72_05900 [Chitinophagaceae bacterium]|jgi:hypothetical protein|nr:hypothetical protein [Chitinophagaceae bacterium]